LLFHGARSRSSTTFAGGGSTIAASRTAQRSKASRFSTEYHAPVSHHSRTNVPTGDQKPLLFIYST
jgi:hypothetical protein